MLDGVVLLWFVLTAMAVLFVAIDIRTTPESPVLKWGFVLVTAYTGVFGAFLYVPRLPRTATWVARTVYLVALAAGAGVNNALRRRRRRRHPGWRSGRRHAPTQRMA